MTDAKVLIIHQGAIGDFIQTFPAIIRLQARYRSVDVLCQSQLGKMAEYLELAEKWHPLESAWWASLFSDQIDPKIKSLLAPYDKIIVFSLSEQLEKSINQAAGKPVCRIPSRPPAHERIHVAQFILDGVYRCGLIKEADAALDSVPLPARKSQQPNRQKILLHPGAGSIRKRWPITRLLQVADMLEKDGLKPEFILGPAEETLVDELKQQARLVHMPDDLIDLAVLLESAGGYIGNDSGASHLAACLGLPTAVIFGPSDPVRWAPLGRAVSIVRPGLKCRPCFETDPANCDDQQCLAAIHAQKVVEIFYKVYPNESRKTI
jgi:ADP-heptose:LPS heptosyltransferase